MNQFSERGVDVVDDSSGLYHVSGHANRPDLERMHDIVKPKILIPMHGEHRHLRQHARLGEEKGIASTIAVNGMMVDLTGDAPKVAEYIDTGRTYLDGSVKIGAMDGIVRDRIRMALNGLVVVTAILDEDDEPLGEPWVDLKGLAETGQSNAALAEVMEEDLNQFLMRAKQEDPERRRQAGTGAEARGASDCPVGDRQEARGHGGRQPHALIWEEGALPPRAPAGHFTPEIFLKR